MVLPDGRGTEPERPRLDRRALLTLALAVVAVGALLMGSLTDPAPVVEEALQTTTTTASIEPPVDPGVFSIEQIETGDQLEWRQVAEMEGVAPKSLVAHRGWVYVFSPATTDGGGARAWRSEDGKEWETLGTVIAPTHRISSVASTSLGLIAIEPDASDDYVHVWGSVDGVNWLEIVDGIPVAGSRDDVDFYPSAIAADDRILAVAGRVEPDVTRLAETHLEASTGEEVDLSGVPLGWISSPEDLHLTIYAPFGYPAARISGTELGLTDAQRSEISGYFLGRPEGATIWTKADDDAWQVGEVEDAQFISALARDEDGVLRAFGTGYVPGSWVSYDGVGWEKVNDSTAPSRVEVWGDRLIGIGDTGMAADVVISGDGETWRESGLADRFPSGVDWHPLGFATGPGGVAAVVSASADQRPRGVPETPSLTSGGTTLTLDHRRGVVHLDDGESLYTWSIGVPDPEGIDIDLAGRTMAFSNPVNGELVGEFDFDRLFSLEARTPVGTVGGSPQLGFVFSADGSRWTIQGMTEEIGPDATLTHVEVTADRVFALVERLPERDRPYGVEGFEVWAAPLSPDG